MQCNILTFLYPLFTTPKIHTDLLWDLTFLFLGLSMFYFSCIFFFRNKQATKATQIVNRKKVLSPMISEFLFFDEAASKGEKSTYVQLKIEIRELLKDRFNRAVLCGMLLDLQQDVSGDTKKRVLALYRDLGLHQEAYAKLKSWRWEVVAQGILELTQMQITEAYELIIKFINDRRGVIRKQAEIATVTLKHEGINYFLDTTEHSISEWQQLKLLDILRHMEGFTPPKFKAWLTSKNKFVVLFALRLIKYYNQNEAYTSITALMKHKNDQIQSEAIRCIKEFRVLAARETLKNVFWKAKVDIQLQILDTLAIFGQETDLEFLKQIENKPLHYSVRSKALSSINTICPDSIIPTEDIIEPKGNQIPEDIIHNLRNAEPLEHNAASMQPPEHHLEDMENKSLSLNWLPRVADPLEMTYDEPISHRQEIFCIDFIPLVVGTQGEGNYQSDTGSTEIPSTSLTPTPILEDLLNFDFLPIICENKEAFQAEASVDSYVLRSEGMKDIKGAMPSEQLHEGVPVGLHETNDVEKVMDTSFLPLVKENINKKEEEMKFQLPAACFAEDLAPGNLLETFIDQDFGHMDTLDTIEELGDQREIPLLKNMLSATKDKPTQQRIHHVMQQLNERLIRFKKEIKPVSPIEDPDIALYSIFNDYFKNSDTEAKLILLEHIAAVGDEKELHFLSKLQEDPEIEIRTLAKREYDILNHRLSLARENDKSLKTKEVEKKPAKTNTLFDIDFELGQEMKTPMAQEMQEEDKEEVVGNTVRKKSIFDVWVQQALEYSGKMMEKYNG